MTGQAISPVIPDLVFTAAITGHQDIAAADRAALTGKITALLEGLRAGVLAACDPANSASNAVDAGRAASFRFVSALAPGADQIGADAALQAARTGPDDPHRWQLNVVLPFDRHSYTRLAEQALWHRLAQQDPQHPRLTEGEIAPAVAAIEGLAKQADRVLELADWLPSEEQPGNTTSNTDHWHSRRYATLGQMLVRQADLLIALWDGSPPNGPGGTADVVSEARRSGVPVVWIQRDAPHMVQSFVPNPATSYIPASDLVARAALKDELIMPLLVAGGDTAAQWAIQNVLLGNDAKRRKCVQRYINDEPIRRWNEPSAPDEFQYGDHNKFYAWMLYLALRIPRALKQKDDAARELRSWPFRAARDEGQSKIRPRVLLYKFSNGVSRADPAINHDTGNTAALLSHAEHADAIATRRGNQYRSAYVLIFALAPIAVACAVAGALIQDWKPYFVMAEMLTVALAVWIYLRSNAHDPAGRPPHTLRWIRRQDSHQRWMEARLIAESQRGGQLLAWIGFAGRRPLEEQAEKPHNGQGHAHPPRTVWAPWFANAIATLPNLPAPDLAAGDGAGEADAQPAAARMLPPRIARIASAAEQVIEDQRGYHDLNFQRLMALNHRLDKFSVLAIAVAFIISAAYLALWVINWPDELGLWSWHLPEHSLTYDLYVICKYAAAFCGAVLPALAAAAAGIRYHGDFERFAMRSEDTATRLEALAKRARNLGARAKRCGETACTGQAPLFEPLLALLLDTQAVLDEDLADWRFAYAARPITMG